MRKNVGNYMFVILLIFVCLFVNYVASIPSYHTSGTTSYITEDQSPVFQYNLSSNVTKNNSDADDNTTTFTIRGINSTYYLDNTSAAFYTWITINSSNGVLRFNATQDNHTGRYNISILVENAASLGESRLFYFVANATNDEPNFTSIQNEYNLTQNQTFTQYINASDEENHFPLLINASFLNNCTHALWSVRTNCSLLTILNFSNTSGRMNFTSVRDDVGTYYANITVMDGGVNYTCSTGYCAPGYSTNKTKYYSTIVLFNVFSTLDINITNCQNKIFQENQSGACQINISTKGINSTFNVSTLAIMKNFGGSVSNNSWFFPVNTTYAVNFSRTLYINITPGKTEVGNWTINITVFDITHNENKTEQISVFVNRTFNDIPDIISVSEKTTSINLDTTINLTVYDNDLLIPDKNASFGGYNESINFSVRIYNRSNFNQQFNISGFDVDILNMPVSGSNRTEASIQFTPNSSEFGNYTVNITVYDNANSRDYVLFNLTILNNSAPVWNSSVSTVFVFYEGNNTVLNFSLNVSDPNGDRLTFTFANNSAFPNFSLNSSNGMANLTFGDGDVGEHFINITVNDSYLTDVKTFNFTIYNVPDPVYVEKPIEPGDLTNATVGGNNNINVTEDNVTTIALWVHDEDFIIPTNQKSFYNESISLNLTIQGPSTNLFTFTINTAFPTAGSNRSNFQAIFTPNKSAVGSYNITVNASDSTNRSDVFKFNITVFSIQHNPVLMNITNHSTAINRSFYYRINVSDVEDGSSTTSGNKNFTYRYSFINGSDFISNNQTRFNTTTGELNISFNSSLGFFIVNITVNDSSGREDSGLLEINIYNQPVRYLPSNSTQFSLIENESANHTFMVNHSVGDNLTYIIYITAQNSSQILRLNSSYYGNSSNFSWEFRPNFTDEITNGNLTLVAYPSNTAFTNRSDYNVTRSWNITINHSNSPLSFSGTIGGDDATVEGTTPVSITLSDFFSDVDADDSRYNQTIRFIFNQTNSSGGTVTISIVNWTNDTNPSLTFSASAVSSVSGFVTAYESNHSNSSQIINTVLSTNFTVNLSIASTTSSSSGSGGGGGGGVVVTPIAFKLILPGSISTYNQEHIDIPLSLYNSGRRSFLSINLTASGFRQKTNSSVITRFNQSFIDVLAAGERRNVTLSVFFERDSPLGTYDIYINATSLSPQYSDWAKIAIYLEKINQSDAEKLLIFTKELIVQNPECDELRELLKGAQAAYDKGDYQATKLQSEAIIDACRENIAQVSLPRTRDRFFNLPSYLVISIILSVLGGIAYYILRILWMGYTPKKIGYGEDIFKRE